jgi:hypothetical protein
MLCVAGWVVPASAAHECPRCGWRHPESANTRFAETIEALEKVLSEAPPDTAIFLRGGTYRLRRMLDVRVPRLVLRGLSGDPTHVVLEGESALEKNVGVGLSISAPDVVISDLTVANVGFHGIQVRGEKQAHGTVLHNVRVRDTGQQLVKGSAGPDGHGADLGLVSCSSFSYTTKCPEQLYELRRYPRRSGLGCPAQRL